MKRNKRIAVKPGWFKIENYAKENELSYQQLAINLDIRLQIYESCIFNMFEQGGDLGHGFDQELVVRYLSFLRKKPLITQEDLNGLNHDHDEYVKKQIETDDNDITDFLSSSLADSYLTGDRLDEKHVTNLKNKDIYLAYRNTKDFSSDVYHNPDEEYKSITGKLVRVDLNAPGTVLLKQFKEWVMFEKSKIEYSFNYSAIKLKGFIVCHQLLAFADLKIWDYLESINLTQEKYCEFIWPDPEHAYSGSSDKYGDMKKYFEKVYTRSAIKILDTSSPK